MQLRGSDPVILIDCIQSTRAGDDSLHSATALPALGFGLLQDGDVGVGVFAPHFFHSDAVPFKCPHDLIGGHI